MSRIKEVINSLKRDYNVIFDEDGNYPVEIDFEKLENSRIVLSDNVKETLNNIMLTTITDNKEIGFICYGMEYIENQVILDEIIISDSLLKSEVTEFGPIITEQLKRKINSNVDDRTVVCLGHSHPKISEDYEYFSLTDLSSLMELTLKKEEFKNKDMQLIGCLISKDIKFAYYNPDDDKFYKMTIN